MNGFFPSSSTHPPLRPAPRNLTPLQEYRLQKKMPLLPAQPSLPKPPRAFLQQSFVQPSVGTPSKMTDEGSPVDKRHTLTVKIHNPDSAVSNSRFQLEVFVNVLNKRVLVAPSLGSSNERILAKDFRLNFDKFISYSVPVLGGTSSNSRGSLLEFKVVIFKNKNSSVRKEVLLGFKQFIRGEKHQSHRFDFSQRNSIFVRRVEVELILETQDRPRPPFAPRPPITPFLLATTKVDSLPH